ncbi:MAG: tRNA (adenosine(37)-N6)-dimethylallyltransferase MiaA [Dehalococcoidia bacterium]|nr:tRNA (adenosine(37)-N6)-dimethylallyltransferase MiaA [Dehalococcoidia bacterium]
MTQPLLLAIVGPTAVGKSEMALLLAELFHGEVVNADSRQLYQRMDTGTAKPSAEARARVPHHLYDVAPPTEPIGLARYLDFARPIIAGVQRRGRLPILVGGSGQYVWALLEGWQAPRVPPDPVLRRQLEQEATQHGAAHLHAKLRAVDPLAAQTIDPRNVRRVIRALEVHHATGQPFSQAKGKTAPPFRVLVIGLTTPTRQELYERIDRRVDALLEAGWLDEVRSLVSAGYGASPVFQSSMGYPELAQALSGDITLDGARSRIKAAHHRLARHQYAWFRSRDARIHWLRASTHERERAEELVTRSLTPPDAPVQGNKQADNLAQGR